MTIETKEIFWYCEKDCKFRPGGAKYSSTDPHLKEKLEQHRKAGCAELKLGNPPDSLAHGVKEDPTRTLYDKEPLYYESALKNEVELEKLLENVSEIKEYSDEFKLHEITKLLIISRHIVSVIDLVNELETYRKRFNINTDIKFSLLALSVIGESEIFPYVKKICYSLGESKKDVCFGQSQTTEVAYWLMGRYHIKRLELTGDLLFWNDCYYEKNAEALIRRSGRQCMLKSKNSEMNEIIKHIEDTCPIIKFTDIENAVHLKCMLNGVYNIKTGNFTELFHHENIITIQIPHRYDVALDYTEIDKCVSSIISDSTDKQSFFDFLSLCLHPYTGIDLQFGGVGIPGTGKSQLSHLCKLVLGEDNVSFAKIHSLAKDQTTQKDCAFKMLNIDEDMSSESIKEIDTIKKWVTQQPFTGRGIYEHSSTYRPMSRLAFMANELYEIPNEDDAEAIYERTHLIRLDNKFRGTNKQIKNVMDSIATEMELSGLITFLLKNSTEIFKMQKIHSPMDSTIVEDTWNQYGNRIKSFITKWVERGASYVTEQNEPWDRWLSYALKNNFKSKDRRKFKEIFEELIGNTPTRTRIDSVQCYAYHGLRVKTEDEIAIEETSPLDDEERELQKLQALTDDLLKIIPNIKYNKNKNIINRAFRALKIKEEETIGDNHD